MIAAETRGAPEYRVTEVLDRAELGRLEREWDALLDDSPARGTLFLRHAFLRIWLDNFAPRARLRVLLARDGGGTLQAALPLIEQRQRLCGVPVNALVSASNPHSCRFDVLARDGAKAAAAFFKHLAADERWDLIRLGDVPEGGNGGRLHRFRSLGSGRARGDCSGRRLRLLGLLGTKPPPSDRRGCEACPGDHTDRGDGD